MVIRLFNFDDEERLEKCAQMSESSELVVFGRISLMRADTTSSRKGYRVRVQEIQSLDLQSGSPDFGEWKPVTKYGELLSDPDVTSAAVLVADVQILSLEPIYPTT